MSHASSGTRLFVAPRECFVVSRWRVTARDSSPYIVRMKQQRDLPHNLEFDPSSTRELARRRESDLALLISHESVTNRAFNGYTRELTARGGVLITYYDQLRNPTFEILRDIAFFVASALVGWVLLRSPLSWPGRGLVFAVIETTFWFFTFRKIIRRHQIEIHPDGMEVDGRTFFIEAIGENWPALQMMVDDDEDRLTLCGIYGTRFVEYATANRVDVSDRTPEVLAEDLEMAMEQLWGRRDAMVATASRF